MKRTVLIGMVALTMVGASALHAAVLVLDDEDPGWSTTGAWTEETGGNEWNGDEWYQSVPNNGATATWSFSGLAAGRYYVSTSWLPGSNRTTAAQYTLSDGVGLAGIIDQTPWASHDMWIEVGGSDNTSGAGFARVSNFNGYVAHFISDGTLAVTTSHSVGGRYLIADAIRLEAARALVEKIWVIDNEDLAAGGYTESGAGWSTFAGDTGDHRVDLRFSGGLSDTATFAFTGLDDGLYRVSAAWTGGGNRTTQALFTIPGHGSLTVNQQIAASGDTFEDVLWQDLFFNVGVSGGTLSVILSNAGAGGVLIADALRIEKMIPEPGTLSLLALGGLGLWRRRRRAAA